jgi:CDP-diacylglycerol--serine O-phosphatidyltransferase
MLSGLIAVLLASQNNLAFAGFFVILGIVFDFFDGFVARMLNVQSELGVQLDSMADMVTSGVAPGIIMFQLLRGADADWTINSFFTTTDVAYLPFLGLLVTLAAGYRLANFNIDENQTEEFIGVPTPALTLFIISIPIINHYGQHVWVKELVKSEVFLVVTVLVGSFLMNAKLALFALKFKNFKFKGNEIKFIFLLLSLGLIIWLQVTAIPFVIVLYIVLSVIRNLTRSKS